MPKKASKTKTKSHSKQRQIAALPYRVADCGAIEILVMTSRETQRFILPKGWPIKGLSPSDAAAREAFEEAGLVGKARRKPFGRYRYWKRFKASFGLVDVDVYPLEVRKQRKKWPEKGERHMRWLSFDDAALLVDEPELETLLLEFGRKRGGGGGGGPRPAGAPRARGG
ncbi:NUDIX hydrolase, partial [Consotaella aegiceratis]|uniref:NUDIX hydrolase n=1 Tax=Consotaella aegiceratis TaxID=3097961 RepID=UPI002F3F45E6